MAMATVILVLILLIQVHSGVESLDIISHNRSCNGSVGCHSYQSPIAQQQFKLKIGENEILDKMPMLFERTGRFLRSAENRLFKGYASIIGDLEPDQQHFNPKIGKNQSVRMPMVFETTRRFLNSAEIGFFKPYPRIVDDLEPDSGSLCQEMHGTDATFCDQKFDAKIFKPFDFSPIDSTGPELQRQEAKEKRQSPENKNKDAYMVSILSHVSSLVCFMTCAMVAIKLIRKHDEPMMARQMELRFLGSRLGLLFAILLTENSSMKFTLEEIAELLGTLLPELLFPVLKHDDSFIEEFKSSFRSVVIITKSFQDARKEKERPDDYNPGDNNAHIKEEYFFEEGDACGMSAEKQQYQKLADEIGLHFQEPLALQKQVGRLVLAEDYRKGISTLSSEGHLANLSSNSQLVSFEDRYLKILEKSVKEQERLNKIKSIGLCQKQKLLSVEEQHLRLTSESNSLMERNMILSRAKHLLRLQETEDSKLMKAYAGLRKSIAEGLTIGILVMILVLMYASWTYSAERIVEHVSVCQPAGKDTSLLYSLESLTVPFTALICKGIVIGRMVFGLLLLAPVALLLTWYSKSNQEAPAAKVFLVLVFVCAFLGHISIESLGGNGMCWLCLYEIFCLAHVFASWITPSLYRILNDPFSRASGSYWISPRVRYAVFWIVLDLLLPAMAGLLPFQPLSRAIPKFFYDIKDYFSW